MSREVWSADPTDSAKVGIPAGSLVAGGVGHAIPRTSAPADVSPVPATAATVESGRRNGQRFSEPEPVDVAPR